MNYKVGRITDHGLAVGARLIAALLLAVALLVANATFAESYTLGVVPQFNARTLQSIWTPILQELERRTGHTFVLQGSENISAFEKQFMDGEFDFAYMNPYHFVKATKQQGYLPLVRDTGKRLRGILVVRKDAEINDVAQLQDKAIAFPSPNALGASLMMRALLSEEFKLGFEPRYVKSHDSVYLNVVLGRTVAGGGVGRTLAGQPAEVRDQLRVLYTSPAVASHPFTAHPRVPKAVRELVQDALIAMGENESERQLLAKIPIGTAGPALSEDYAPLRAMGLEAFYVSK
jgi:phosphonate transport system substrate-binding protein